MISLEMLDAWGSAWLGCMARALVEGSVLLAVIAAAWLPFRRRISAQFAHGLFCLVLLKLIIPMPLTPYLWPSGAGTTPTAPAPDRGPAPDPAPVRAPSPPAAMAPTTGDLGTNLAEASAAPEPVVMAEPAAPGGEEPARVVATAPPLAPRRLPSAAVMLMIAWALCAAWLLVRFLLATLATHRLLRDAEPVRPGWVPVDLDALRLAPGLDRRVRWAVDPRIHSPAVGGLIRPKVVIPPDLCEGLTPKQLSWVLLHELAHVRRGDLWVVIAQRLTQAVFWFHPAVYLTNWIIDELREYACDDAALAARPRAATAARGSSRSSSWPWSGRRCRRPRSGSSSRGCRSAAGCCGSSTRGGRSTRGCRPARPSRSRRWRRACSWPRWAGRATSPPGCARGMRIRRRPRRRSRRNGGASASASGTWLATPRSP